MRYQISVVDIGLYLAIRVAVSRRNYVILVVRSFYPGHAGHLRRALEIFFDLQQRRSYPGIDHKSKDILYAVEGKDTAIDSLPHLLVIDFPSFDRCAQFVDEFGVGDGDLEIWTLLVALESKQILPHYHLDRFNGLLVLC